MFSLSAPVMLVNLFVIAGTVAAVYFTGNPMCLVALYFMQPMPQFAPGPIDESANYVGEKPDAEESEYASNKMGFTGEI